MTLSDACALWPHHNVRTQDGSGVFEKDLTELKWQKWACRLMVTSKVCDHGNVWICLIHHWQNLSQSVHGDRLTRPPLLGLLAVWCSELTELKSNWKVIGAAAGGAASEPEVQCSPLISHRDGTHHPFYISRPVSGDLRIWVGWIDSRGVRFSSLTL